MLTCKLLLVSALCFAGVQVIYGHGKMTDPINRSSVWRVYPDAPRTDEDNENFCGGIGIQYGRNGGKCGPCGDNYTDPIPRKNENGGKFGRGRVVKTYKSGSTIKVVVDLSANHKGYFEFSICRLSSPSAVETEACFERYPLKVIEKGQVTDKFHVGELQGDVVIDVQLPRALKCERCVLRWHYRCGNNWGVCDPETGAGDLGCGDQEIFRSCSDIAIQ